MPATRVNSYSIPDYNIRGYDDAKYSCKKDITATEFITSFGRSVDFILRQNPYTHLAINILQNKYNKAGLRGTQYVAGVTENEKQGRTNVMSANPDLAAGEDGDARDDAHITTHRRAAQSLLKCGNRSQAVVLATAQIEAEREIEDENEPIIAREIDTVVKWYLGPQVYYSDVCQTIRELEGEEMIEREESGRSVHNELSERAEQILVMSGLDHFAYKLAEERLTDHPRPLR